MALTKSAVGKSASAELVAAAAAHAREQDLVVGNCRRLVGHAHAVVEGHDRDVVAVEALAALNADRRERRDVEPGHGLVLVGRHRGGVGGGEGGGERGLRREGLVGGARQHDAARAVGEVGLGEGVDLREPDAVEVAAREREVVLGGDQRFVVEEGLHQGLGVAAARGRGGLLRGLAGCVGDVGLRALEFAGREAVLQHAAVFFDDLAEGLGGLAGLHDREGAVAVHVADHAAAPGAREGEGRVGVFAPFGKTRAEHAVVKPGYEVLAEVAFVVERRLGQEVVDLQQRVARLRVGGHDDLGFVVRRTGVLGARAGLRRVVEVAEERLNLGFDLGRLDVADGDHGHEVGAVPVAVEALQGVVGRALEHRRIADREAIHVAAVGEGDRQGLVAQSLLGPEA